jgi:hypothetical protein
MITRYCGARDRLDHSQEIHLRISGRRDRGAADKKEDMRSRCSLRFSAAAMSADLPPLYKAPPVQLYSWSGCYFGGQLGQMWARQDWTDRMGPPPFGRSYGNLDATGFISGVQGGCTTRPDRSCSASKAIISGRTRVAATTTRLYLRFPIAAASKFAKRRVQLRSSSFHSRPTLPLLHETYVIMLHC